MSESKYKISFIYSTFDQILDFASLNNRNIDSNNLSCAIKTYISEFFKWVESIEVISDKNDIINNKLMSSINDVKKEINKLYEQIENMESLVQSIILIQKSNQLNKESENAGTSEKTDDTLLDGEK